MSEKKPEPTKVTQYGVRYPSGLTAWLSIDTVRGPMLPGASGVTALLSAADRGKFMDEWRQQVGWLGIDPDTVPAPVFVTREIVTTYASEVEVTHP